jgi:SAM-dependent methyltransferase
VRRVLDFGCGCGRLTRLFARAQPGWEAYGSDVNPDLVQWCADQLAPVRTTQNDLTPPLAFDAASFDLVYSVSVFSHLAAAAAQAWLADLARVLRPGGILLVTTHGPRALEIIQSSPTHQAMVGLSAAEAADVSARLLGEGLIFRQYADRALARAKSGADYGNAFVDPAYLARRWAAPYFELAAPLGALRGGWQDVAVLRRI